jgi:hypothetical protein
VYAEPGRHSPSGGLLSQLVYQFSQSFEATPINQHQSLNSAALLILTLLYAESHTSTQTLNFVTTLTHRGSSTTIYTPNVIPLHVI